MKIAIIGYGSLIWDLDDLAPKVTGDWKRGQGPTMPIEFARVSPKRKMGLVLVTDERFAPHSRTSVIDSLRNRLDDAVEDLAARERTSTDLIGFVSKASPPRARFSSTGTHIRAWLDASPYDAAVWTDLDGNFEQHTGAAYTHASALAYLQSLTGESLREAWRYISFAPEETQTPLRSFLADHPWWLDICTQMKATAD